MVRRGITMAFGRRRGKASRVAALIAAYALVLQAFFAGAAVARGEVGGHGDAYALCLSADGTETPAQPLDKIHCVHSAVCAAQAHWRGVEAAPPVAPVANARTALWPPDGAGAAADRAPLRQRTRAPPAA
jgi:hypothetical protein